MGLHVIDHPLVHHLMASLRDKGTPPDSFRVLTRRLGTILALEATRSIRTDLETIETPLESTQARRLQQGVAAVPILRAGLGLLEPVVELFPDTAVGYIGLERHHDTAVAHSYYCKLPELASRFTLCLDPMLATGGSASQALSLLRAGAPASLTMICVVAAPEGVRRVQEDHPDVQIVTAALDRELNASKYILPGLGDFGDRLYGTG